MNNSVKPGDLWLVMGNTTREPCVFYLIKKAEPFNDKRERVVADVLTSDDEELELNVKTSVHLTYDRKITDPEEQAYWLLRFENERSKNGQ